MQRSSQTSTQTSPGRGLGQMQARSVSIESCPGPLTGTYTACPFSAAMSSLGAVLPYCPQLRQDHDRQLGTGGHPPWILHKIPLISALSPHTPNFPQGPIPSMCPSIRSRSFALQGGHRACPTSQQGMRLLHPILPYPKERWRCPILDL